jgi:hypothetical protein
MASKEQARGSASTLRLQQSTFSLIDVKKPGENNVSN